MSKIVSTLLVLVILSNTYRLFGQLGWQWEKNAKVNEVMRVVTDGAGDSYVAGFNEAPDTLKFGDISEYGQIFATKVDSSGNYLWSVATVKGSYGELFPDIAYDGAGNAYLLGSYTDSICTIGTFTLVNPTNHSDACFLVKISNTGVVLWAKTICNANAANLCADPAGNVYVAGGYFPSATIGTATLTSAGDYDIFIVKYNTSGTQLWVKSIGGVNADEPTAIRYSEDNHFYLAGSFISEISIGGSTVSDGSSDALNPGKFVAKFDTAGKLIWAKDYDKYIDITRLAAANFNFFYMAGNVSQSISLGSSTLTNKGSTDAFIAKCDSSGNIIWGIDAGGASNEVNYDLAADMCGKLWICGKMGSENVPYTMDFGDSSLTTPPNSNDPTYVAEYDSTGKYLQSFSFGSGGDDYMGISVDNKGNFVMSGDYTGATIKFGTDSLSTGLGGETFFVAKYKYADSMNCFSPASTSQIETSPDVFKIFPNPAFNELNITTTGEIHTVVVTNMLGQVVFKGNFNAGDVTIPIATLHTGIYFVEINGLIERRFLKE